MDVLPVRSIMNYFMVDVNKYFHHLITANLVQPKSLNFYEKLNGCQFCSKVVKMFAFSGQLETSL